MSTFKNIEVITNSNKKIIINETMYEDFLTSFIDLFEEYFGENYEDMIQYSFNYIETTFLEALVEVIKLQETDIIDYNELSEKWVSIHKPELQTVYGFCS
ncbi:MAG: hypothetical protein ACPKM0_09740 [Pleomorphochaeta sp.]